MRRSLGVLALGLALIGAGACGSEDSALAQTEQNLSELKSATMDLRLAATSGRGDSKTDPVGFHLEGPFALDDKHDLAVFDLTYTRLLGGDESVSKVRSTGEAAFVTVDSRTYRVPESELDSLRISDDASGGLSDLGIASWVRNEKSAVKGETEVISGDVDVAEMLSDIARIAQSVGGETELAALDGDAAERLQKLVQSSSIEVVTTREGRQLRSLRAVVDFGTRAPEELRRTLGKYADAQIEVNLVLEKAPADLRVEAPDDAVDL